MRIKKCPNCGEFLHAEATAEAELCWNCGAFVLLDGATTWDRDLADWVDKKVADPDNMVPVILPMVLLLLFYFLRSATTLG